MRDRPGAAFRDLRDLPRSQRRARRQRYLSINRRLSRGALPPARPSLGEGSDRGPLLARAGIQQCCQHIIRRCRAVIKLGPGGLQSWAGDIIEILREAHQAVEAARARGHTVLDAEMLDKLRQRYDEAAAFGIIHNRLRNWHQGNHPGYALGCWLRDYKEQVFLFTRDFAVDWTNSVCERGAKAARRHQAVSGYWHCLATLSRWCDPPGQHVQDPARPAAEIDRTLAWQQADPVQQRRAVAGQGRGDGAGRGQAVVRG